MKKTLSIVLSLLLVACTMLPAFAAGGTFNVTFQGPSVNLETDPSGAPAFSYYKTINGEFAEFVEDPDGGYGYYSVDGFYYYIDDLTTKSREVFDNAEPGSPESVRYSPAPCENGTVAAGETISFIVVTNEIYDQDTVRVLCNGDPVTLNSYGEYSVVANRDLAFSVQEKDDNNVDVLARNRYTVTLASGDGFAAKPLKYENNRLVEYGGDFSFRVKITKGFNGDNMKVKVIRGTNFLAEFLGEDADTLSSVMGEAETLSSTGVDEDGFRTYKIRNITSDCKVLISGVNEASSSNVLAMLKRILRLLLGLLGINLDGLLGEDNNPLAAYTVTLDATGVDSGLATYTTNPKFTYNNETGNYEAEVLSGECITIVTNKKKESTNVSVTWTPREGTEPYNASWQSYYNLETQKTTWSAVWYVDGITADTTITITASDPNP